MINLLLLLIINSFICFGFWNACLFIPSKRVPDYSSSSYCFKDTPEVKGVLWFIEKWAKGKWFHKPLCDCLPCMASFHSIYPYWMMVYLSGADALDYLMIYPAYILALSGLNYIIDLVIHGE